MKHDINFIDMFPASKTKIIEKDKYSRQIDNNLCDFFELMELY